jgi:hypothetical protein
VRSFGISLYGGRHTYDFIAAALDCVHAEYRISSKIIMTVTDNRANFVEAFKEFASGNEDNSAASTEWNLTTTVII